MANASARAAQVISAMWGWSLPSSQKIPEEMGQSRSTRGIATRALPPGVKDHIDPSDGAFAFALAVPFAVALLHLALVLRLQQNGLTSRSLSPTAFQS